MVGKALGHYEILGPLGAGGMGEVYRARDTSLDRDVAIKVLPEDFAEDAERLARFEREAKLLASLNHTNIAVIHGLEESDGVRFIAMELVEGDTLAERVGAAGGLDVEDVLTVARQIAEALEAAHEAGIVHRDLKPANVKVTPEGKVKVLDFGLAKAYEVDGTAAEISPDLSHSPTLAAATRTGVILGTAAYMSPEQARGKLVDRRTDIWAFGCVLYEMLTGRRPFGGETVSDTMAAILKEQPEWNALPVTTPAAVRRVLRRCLTKEPSARLQHIGDARIELSIEDLDAGGFAESAVEPRPLARALPWALAALGLTAAAVTIVVSGSLTPSGPLRPMVRSSIVLPPEAPLAPPGSFFLGVLRPSLALSKDGRWLVWVAQVQGTRQLWMRDMRTGETRPMAGTADAHVPFFSPDGDWLGFFGEGKLKIVRVEGGEPQALSDAVSGFGAEWGADGWIYFVPTEGTGVYRVPASGGAVEQVTTPAGSSVYGHYWPALLPGGKRLLVTARRFFGPSVQGARIGTAEPPDLLIEAGNDARYAPTRHLLYGLGGNLLAAPFDPDNMSITGASTVVFDDVRTGASVQASWSEDGTLVYAPGPDLLAGSFVWIDRAERRLPVDLPSATYGTFELSPDGSLLAYPVHERGQSQLWLYELDRGAPRLLTRGAVDDFPVWAPEGDALFFSRHTAEGTAVHRIDIGDATQASVELIPPREHANVMAVLDEGLIYMRDARDILFVPFGESAASIRENDRRAILDSPAQEVFAALSPDGRWLTYVSDESGHWEVYVISYPDAATKRRVSTFGGEEPRWGPNGREIIYRYGSGWYAVAFAGEPELTLGDPALLFEGPYINVYGYSWDLSPDGERFLVLENPDQGRALTELVVITNFFDELKRLVPTER